MSAATPRLARWLQQLGEAFAGPAMSQAVQAHCPGLAVAPRLPSVTPSSDPLAAPRRARRMPGLTGVQA